jgi:hypothetical protein
MIAVRTRWSDLGQPAYVVGVEAVQHRGDPHRQPGLAQEAAVGVRGGGEAVGHPHSGGGQVRDHLAERGVLAADLLQVGQTEIGEPDHVAHVGLLG